MIKERSIIALEPEIQKMIEQHCNELKEQKKSYEQRI